MAEDVERSLAQGLVALLQASSNTTPLFICYPKAEEMASCIGALHQLALEMQMECITLDMATGNEAAVLERLQTECRQGEWVLLLNTQTATREVLRHIALSIFTPDASALSFAFRLWLTHLGDINPADDPHYPSPLLVPALFLTSSGKVASKTSLRVDQVEASVTESTASDIFVLEEKLYASDPCMKHLTLTQGHVPHLMELMEAVKLCSTCRTLAFESCTMTAMEVAYIANMLKGKSRVQQLELVQCCLTDDCVMELCQGLRANTGLTSLDLSRNPSITDNGINFLAELLHPQNDCKLQQLRFRMNNSIRHHHALGFHHGSVRHLCRSLRGNCYLTILDLANTKLTPRSVQSLARALRHNKALTSLDISDNRVGDEAGVAIADALYSSNRTLTTLDLSSSGISCITLCALAEVLKQNNILKSLLLNNNRLVQLPEPQHLSNAVFDDHEDYIADPDGQDSSSDEEDGAAQKEPDAMEEEELDDEDEDGLLDDAPQITEVPSSLEAPILVTEELAANALRTIHQRYHRLEGMEALAAALQSNATLSELQMNNCCLCEPSIKLLVDGLLTGNNKTLSKLSIGHNDAFEESASMLIKDLITQHPYITELNVGSNSNVVGERAILALERSTALRHLDISDCNIDQEMMMALFDTIQRNPRCGLRSLSMACNPINSTSFGTLMRTLVLPQLQLMHLNLQSTMSLATLTDLGCSLMKSFGSAVANSPHLKELIFSDNGVTDDAAVCFVETAQPSKSLERVDMSCNHLVNGLDIFKPLSPQVTVILLAQKARGAPHEPHAPWH